MSARHTPGAYVIVSKAAPIHAGDEVPGRTIAITEPGSDFTGENVVAQATAFFKQQAELIHEALTASLPGGTLSNLFALMAADRASIFRVLDPAARINEPSPADGDVVDAEIDYQEWYSRAAEQRAAALAIHRPCHIAPSASRPGATCDLADHDSNEPAECHECSDLEAPVTYPCPTAQALGVAA